MGRTGDSGLTGSLPNYLLMSDPRPTNCNLCQRQIELTFHHLVPRKVHRRTFFRKHFSRQELSTGIYICRKCHSGIHKLFNEMQLAKDLNTLEKLRENPEIARHVSWVTRQKS